MIRTTRNGLNYTDAIAGRAGGILSGLAYLKDEKPAFAMLIRRLTMCDASDYNAGNPVKRL
jgi:hypothetical protein